MNNKTKAPSFLGLITESESLSLKDFSGKYLDCGSMEGYIKSTKEIAK